ncbi:ornithine cyclodeaminase family protein [Mycobacterium sp. BMJ-28]
MTLILSHSDISAVLDRAQVHKAVETAFADLACGDCQNPAPRALAMAGGDGLALPMVATSRDRVAVKLLCDLPGNRDSGLPVQRSTIMLTSARTGECMAILDGRAVTAIRTAAASAVATDHLAAPSAHILGLIGAGKLAVQHAHAIAAVRYLDSIRVWSRSAATLRDFRSATEVLGIPVVAAESPESVVAHADIVCTLTPSREPVVRGDWLRPGQHVNCVGSPPRPDHREIDAAGMRRSRIVVDSHATALAKSGAVLLALAEGAVTTDDVRTELGGVVAGSGEGRTAADQITMFVSVGLALQDLVTADLVVARARELGLGTEIGLSS